MKVGGKKLRLALDTGASVNLLSDELSHLSLPLGELMDVQGLDGQPQLLQKVRLEGATTLPTGDEPTDFVLMEINALRSDSSSGKLDGILGSGYLSAFTVGVDYRRRRVYLWKTLSK